MRQQARSLRDNSLVALIVEQRDLTASSVSGLHSRRDLCQRRKVVESTRSVKRWRKVLAALVVVAAGAASPTRSSVHPRNKELK